MSSPSLIGALSRWNRAIGERWFHDDDHRQLLEWQGYPRTRVQALLGIRGHSRLWTFSGPPSLPWGRSWFRDDVFSMIRYSCPFGLAWLYRAVARLWELTPFSWHRTRTAYLEDVLKDEAMAAALEELERNGHAILPVGFGCGVDDARELFELVNRHFQDARAVAATWPADDEGTGAWEPDHRWEPEELAQVGAVTSEIDQGVAPLR